MFNTWTLQYVQVFQMSQVLNRFNLFLLNICKFFITYALHLRVYNIRKCEVVAFSHISAYDNIFLTRDRLYIHPTFLRPKGSKIISLAGAVKTSFNQ